jgi:uncharacterized protein (TIGR04255 family)
MRRVVLKNKPLVEAIFELRWELQQTQDGTRTDPQYKILVGRVYDKVKGEYPFHEQLPIARAPDELVPYVVQHRFRKGQDEWPLIQMGPGILTVNDTDRYTWEDFEGRASAAVTALFEGHPDSPNLRVSGLLLRYIDAVDFDYEKDDISSFLGEKMKIRLEMDEKLFEGTRANRMPLGVDARFSFRSSRPPGVLRLRFARGKRADADALLWETMVQSSGEDAPVTRERIAAWAREAHNLADKWFFNQIKGELRRRFR